MIKWHFEGFDIYFTSTPENIENHIRKNRILFKTDSPVIYDNGNIHHLNPSIVLGSDGDSTFEDLEALDSSINPDQSEEQEAPRLRSVFNNVDSSTAPPIFVEGKLSNGNASKSGSSLPRKRNR